MNKKRIVVSSINIALSLGILLSLFLSIGFGGEFDDSSFVRMSIVSWTGITNFWIFLGALYFSSFTLVVIIAAVSCIVDEIKNIVAKSSKYGYSGFSEFSLIFTYLIYGYLVFGMGELILYGWAWHFIIRGTIGAILSTNEFWWGFFGTGLFLFPVLFIAHLLFNYFIDDDRKEEKRKKAEAKAASQSVQAENTSSDSISTKSKGINSVVPLIVTAVAIVLEIIYFRAVGQFFRIGVTGYTGIMLFVKCILALILPVLTFVFIKILKKEKSANKILFIASCALLAVQVFCAIFYFIVTRGRKLNFNLLHLYMTPFFQWLKAIPGVLGPTFENASHIFRGRLAFVNIISLVSSLAFIAKNVLCLIALRTGKTETKNHK